uniref:Uncharacterized protein n=1 Tax=Anguilla anguilla TaxID=7936 RepID=A0A0E9PQL3_ANGAN
MLRHTLASRGFKMHNFSVVQTDIHSCQKTRNQPTVPSIISISYVINIIFFEQQKVLCTLTQCIVYGHQTVFGL